MTPRDVTSLVILGTTVLLGLYDVLMGVKYGPEATISIVMYDLARRYPIVPFMLGVLAGHIFWPMAATLVELFLCRR